MLEEIFHLPENAYETLPIGEWFYELIWCPSQCYYHVEHKGIDYILYLRWRHEDPWRAYVVRNVANLDAMNQDDAVWSKDVFELCQLQYGEDELEAAKEKIIQLFHEFDAEFPVRNLLNKKA